MAKFLNTKKAVSEIEDLIRNAEHTLTLISPYLKLSKDFRELLEYRNSKNKITTVIFGKQELNPDEMKFLKGLRFLVLKYKESLHAKYYLNDQKMIITSLNLYQFSMENNKEMGIVLEKENPADSEVFLDALKEVAFIEATSQTFALTEVPDRASKPKGNSIVETREIKNLKQGGFCIRTGVQIPFNPDKPLCADAFKSWNKYADPAYAEKFCHFSGEPSNGETSVAKPILRKNWSKAKELMN